MAPFLSGSLADSVLNNLATVAWGLGVVSVLLVLLTLRLRFLAIRSQVVQRALEERWQPLLLLALEDPGHAEALGATVNEGEELYFIDFVWRFARRVRGTERDTLAGVVAPYLDPLLRRTQHDSEEIRAHAIQTLGVLAIEEHGGTIVSALDDPSSFVAMTAARALTRREHPDYAEEVLARIDRFQSWSPVYLASMLAGLGPVAAEPLRATLQDESKAERSRAVAANALRILRDLESGEIAAHILGEDGPPELLGACAALLGATARPEHLPVLRHLARSLDPIVRLHAVRALAEHGSPADLGRLEVALYDTSPWVALRAAYGLRDLGGTDVLTRLARQNDERAVLAREVLASQPI